MQKLFFIYFVAINFVTFLLFALDKHKAKKNQRRISEKTLYLYSLLGGFIGGMLSIVVFRHKIVKKSFMLKYYMIILLWGILGYGYFFELSRLNFLD